MFFSGGIKRRLHATTLANVLVVGVTAVCLLPASRVLNREYDRLNDLLGQRSCTASLGALASETLLLLERAIYKDDVADIARILANSEDLQSLFSTFRDAAFEHRIVEDESFAKVAEPTIYALRNDIVKCVTLLRKGEQQAAQSHYTTVVQHRAEPIQDFVETSLYAKDVQIDTVRGMLQSFKNKIIAMAVVITTGMVVLVALINARMGRSITEPLAVLTQSTRRLAGGDWTPCTGVEGQDEISALATSFNTTAAKLNSHVA